MRIIAFGTAGEFWSDGKGLKGKYTLKSKFSPVVVFGVLSRMVLVRGS